MMANTVLQRSWVHSHSTMPRAPRQCATHNIDMFVDPKNGGKLARERLQAALPVREKTRKQTITPDGTPGPRAAPTGAKTPFSFTGIFFMSV